MTDVFISYSSRDSDFAQQLYAALTASGVKAFLAEISLTGGTKWSPEIIRNMNKSKWVFFLASRAAVQSAAVQQEVGAAIFSGKEFIPVIWEIRPEDLPGWAKEHQAVDLRPGSGQSLQPVLAKIAKTVKSDEFMAGVILTSLVLGSLYVFTRK